MGKFKKYNTFLVAFLFAAGLILIYKSIDNLGTIQEFFGNLFSILRPFLVGFVIAYILNLPCNKITKMLAGSKNKFIQKRSRGISILIVYFVAILIVVISARAVIPAIYKNFVDMYKNTPIFIEKITNFVNYWQSRLGISLKEFGDEMSIGKVIEDLFKNLSLNEFSKYAQGVINITSGLINTFIAIIVSVYMLMDSEMISNGAKSVMSALVGKKRSESVSAYFNKVNDIFSKYIYCRVIDALIVGILSVIVLSLLGVKYAPALGFLIGFCNLIPYFGSIIGSIIAMLITLVSGGWLKMLWTGISLLVLEQIDGNFIGPKIMGEVLEIRPLWVIFAVTVGGGLFGVLGMLISVPVVVVLKMLGDDYLEARRAKMNEQEQDKKAEEEV